MVLIRRKFLDSLRLKVKGGVGGMGLPKYGGIGGNGGSVQLVAKEGVTLKHVLREYPHKIVRAADGEDSSKRRIYAEMGPPKVVEVPLGITVYNHFNQQIGTLDKEGDRLVVAEGGPGGSPESLPPFCGAKGIQQIITLDLKLIAEVGLVGFPNAGKSTLLKAISRARPKIASYPFTTIQPNLGIIFYPDLRQIKVADLPGLIEGAHANYGMGHRFLKHVERTSMLILIADIFGFQLSPKHKHRTCLETILLLNRELELYNEELITKPSILLINKMDLPGAWDKFKAIHDDLKSLDRVISKVSEEFRPEVPIKFEEILPVSTAYDKVSMNQVKESVRTVLDRNFVLNVTDETVNNELEIVKSSVKKFLPLNRKVM